MAIVARKAAPAPEAIVWDGANGSEVLELACRVADLNVWPPLDAAPLVAEIRDEEPHRGLNITNADDVIVARVEEGNALVFDLFAKTPLFVLDPDELAAFYEVN